VPVGLGVGDVADDDVEIPAFPVEPCGGERRTLGIDVLDEHRRATLGQEPGGRLSDTRTGAGDDGDAITKIVPHPSSATMMVSLARHATVTASPIA
jgi:hypothetical protein